MSDPYSPLTNDALEARLRQAARHLPYPPAPDVAAALRSRPRPAARPSRLAARWVWLTLLIVGLAAILGGVPPVRATVVQFLRLGAVRIFLTEPTPTALLSPTATPLPTGEPVHPPTATPLASLLDLAGETSLAEAQAQLDFPIRLPAEPPELGPPDKVYLQDFQGQLVVLVWLAPERPEQVRLSLHLLGPDAFAGKGAPETIDETTVHGQRALWVTGPHLFWLEGGQMTSRRLVEGNTLIWGEGEITYRLESDLSLSEAVKIAESLK